MVKLGIHVDIPGHGPIDILHLVTDWTGTHSCEGVESEGSLDLIQQLSSLVDVHVLTSDTFGTCRKAFELAGFEVGEGKDVNIIILEGKDHDNQKAEFVKKLGAENVAAFGNGQNDRGMLSAVDDAGGIAIAVDNGEGVARDAMENARITIHGSVRALTLLLNLKSLTATLRF